MKPEVLEDVLFVLGFANTIPSSVLAWYGIRLSRIEGFSTFGRMAENIAAFTALLGGGGAVFFSLGIAYPNNPANPTFAAEVPWVAMACGVVLSVLGALEYRWVGRQSLVNYVSKQWDGGDGARRWDVGFYRRLSKLAVIVGVVLVVGSVPKLLM